MARKNRKVRSRASRPAEGPSATLEVRIAELRRLTHLDGLKAPARVYVSAHLDGESEVMFATKPCEGGSMHQWPHGGKKFEISVSDLLNIKEGQRAIKARSKSKRSAAAPASSEEEDEDEDEDDVAGEAESAKADDDDEAGAAATKEEGAEGDDDATAKKKKKKKKKKDGDAAEGSVAEKSADVEDAAEKESDNEEEDDADTDVDEKPTQSKKASNGRYGPYVPGRCSLTLLVLLSKGMKKKPNAKADTLVGSVTFDLTREARRAKLRRPRMDGAFDIIANPDDPLAWQPLEQPKKGKYGKEKHRDSYMNDALSPELLVEVSYHPPEPVRRALPASKLSGGAHVGQGTRCERLDDKELRTVVQHFYKEFNKKLAKDATAVHRLMILLREHESGIRAELKAEYGHKGNADIFRFFPDAGSYASSPSSGGGGASPDRVPATIKLALSARALEKRDLLSKSDPYVEIYEGRWSPATRGAKVLVRSKTINNNHEPEWEPISFKSKKCKNLKRNGVTLVVKDDDSKLLPDDYMGSVFIEYDELMSADASEFELVLIEKKTKKKKKKKKSPKKKKGADGHGTIIVTSLSSRVQAAAPQAHVATPVPYTKLWMAARKQFLPSWSRSRNSERATTSGGVPSDQRATAIGYITRIIRDIFELHHAHTWEGLLPSSAFAKCVKQLPRASRILHDDQIEILKRVYAVPNVVQGEAPMVSYSAFIARLALESLGEDAAGEANAAEQLLPIIDALRLRVHLALESAENTGANALGKEQSRLLGELTQLLSDESTPHRRNFVSKITRGHFGEGKHTSALTSGHFGQGKHRRQADNLTKDLTHGHFGEGKIRAKLGIATPDAPMEKLRGGNFAGELFKVAGIDISHLSAHHIAVTWCEARDMDELLSVSRLLEFFEAFVFDLLDPTPAHQSRKPRRKRKVEAAVATKTPAARRHIVGPQSRAATPSTKLGVTRERRELAIVLIRRALMAVWSGSGISVAEGCRRVFDHCRIDDAPALPLRDFKVALRVQLGGRVARRGHALSGDAELTDADMDIVADRCDLNGDGTVDLDEFIIVITQNSAPPRDEHVLRDSSELDAPPADGLVAVRCACARRLPGGRSISSQAISFVLSIDNFEVHRSAPATAHSEAAKSERDLLRGPDAYSFVSHLGSSLGIGKRGGGVDAHGVAVRRFESSEHVWRWPSESSRADFEWRMGSTVTIQVVPAASGAGAGGRGRGRRQQQQHRAPTVIGSLTLPAPPPVGTRGAPCWLPLSPPGSGEIQICVSVGGASSQHHRAPQPSKAPDTEALRALACLPPPMVWGVFEKFDPSGMGEISFASLLDAMRLLPLHIPTRYEEESSRRRNVPAHQQVSSRVQATESAMQQWVPALAIRFRAESGMRDGVVAGHHEREGAESARNTLAWLVRNSRDGMRSLPPPMREPNSRELQRVSAATQVDYVRLCREVEDHAAGGARANLAVTNAERKSRAALMPLRSWARDVGASALQRALQREDRDGSGDLPRAVFRHVLVDLRAPVAEHDWRTLLDLFPSDAAMRTTHSHSRRHHSRHGHGHGGHGGDHSGGDSRLGYTPVNYGAFVEALFPNGTRDGGGGGGALPHLRSPSINSVHSRTTAISNGTFIELPRTPSSVRRAATASAERRPNHRGSPPGFEHLTVSTRNPADTVTVRPTTATFASPVRMGGGMGLSQSRNNGLAWECGVCMYPENPPEKQRCKMCKSARNRAIQAMGSSMAMSMMMSGGGGAGGVVEQCLICGWEEPDSAGTGLCCMCGSSLKSTAVSSLQQSLAFDALLAPAMSMDDTFASVGQPRTPAKSPFAERGPAQVPSPTMVPEVVPVPEPILRTPARSKQQKARTTTHAEMGRSPPSDARQGHGHGHGRASTATHGSGRQGGRHGAGRSRPPLKGRPPVHRRAHSDRYLDGGSARKAKSSKGTKHVRSVTRY